MQQNGSNWSKKENAISQSILDGSSSFHPYWPSFTLSYPFAVLFQQIARFERPCSRLKSNVRHLLFLSVLWGVWEFIKFQAEKKSNLYFKDDWILIAVCTADCQKSWLLLRTQSCRLTTKATGRVPNTRQPRDRVDRGSLMDGISIAEEAVEGNLLLV